MKFIFSLPKFAPEILIFLRTRKDLEDFKAKTGIMRKIIDSITWDLENSNKMFVYFIQRLYKYCNNITKYLPAFRIYC